jgi:hypothetical protein
MSIHIDSCAELETIVVKTRSSVARRQTFEGVPACPVPRFDCRGRFAPTTHNRQVCAAESARSSERHVIRTPRIAVIRSITIRARYSPPHFAPCHRSYLYVQNSWERRTIHAGLPSNKRFTASRFAGLDLNYATLLSASIFRNQLVSGFQLVKIWATKFSSVLSSTPLV